jgi:hypothetical protein
MGKRHGAPNVSCDLMSRSSERGQGRKNVDVDLSGICLASDGIRVRESRKLCYELVEFLNLDFEGMSFAWMCDETFF